MNSTTYDDILLQNTYIYQQHYARTIRPLTMCIKQQYCSDTNRGKQFGYYKAKSTKMKQNYTKLYNIHCTCKSCKSTQTYNNINFISFLYIMSFRWTQQMFGLQSLHIIYKHHIRCILCILLSKAKTSMQFDGCVRGFRFRL